MSPAATPSKPLDWTAWLFLTALALFAAWAGARSIMAGWQPETWAYLGGPGLIAAGFLAGRLLPSTLLTRVAAVVVPALTALLVVWPLVQWRPGLGPLGYANANAALAVQVCALAALLWLAPVKGTLWRWLWPAIMVAVTAVVLINQSLAGALVGFPTLMICLASRVRGLSGSRIVPTAGLVGAGFATWGFCWLSSQQAWAAVYERLFSDVRHRLWLRAWEVWQGAPRFGVGPGSFRQLNPLGVDPDTAPAHSVLLQVAAELGWAGLVLLALIVLTGFLVLFRCRTVGVTAAAAAWTALWVHSLVDHLTEFWPVPLAAGLVLGWGTLRTVRRRPK